MTTALRRALWVAVVVLGVTPAAWANPTQEDVFKSISSNVDHSGSINGTAVIAVAAAAVGVVLVAVVVNARQSRQAAGGWSTGGTAAGRAAGPVNHSGKLLRELMKETGLTRAQVRQLEAANDRLAADDRGVDHLVTLLLCPSLLAASRGADDAGL